MWRSSSVLFIVLFAAQAQQYIVSTVAGGVPPATPVAALQASIGGPVAVAADVAGNIYFSSTNCVFKIDTKGVLTRVAGTSRPGFSGDNGLATDALLFTPTGLAPDPVGNLYVADGSPRIRKIAPSGIITTVAGKGSSGFSGDGGQATSAELAGAFGVTLDASGGLYIADTLDETIRKISTSGVISTFTGIPYQGGFLGDSIPLLRLPFGVAVDAANNVLIADSFNNRIRRVSPAGIISTVAGPSAGSTGNPLKPYSLAVDQSGAIYVGSNTNFVSGVNYVGKVSSTGVYSIVAGMTLPTGNFSGDGGAATSAELCSPSGVTVDLRGNLYFADQCNNRIRKVSIDGTIITLAGNGTAGFSGDGGAAGNAQLSVTINIAADHDGNLYIADGADRRVRMIDSAGKITTIAGNGTAGFSGDDGAATSAQLSNPSALAIDAGGNVYVSDTGTIGFRRTSRIRKISPKGIITTVAGTGLADSTGDGGLATVAQINAGPIAVDAIGNIYFADDISSTIRKISSSGIITTFAGGTANSSADGVPALNAYASSISALATDAAGNLLLATHDIYLVREISSSSGLIKTIAGAGQSGYAGDGDAATRAQISYTSGMVADATGNIYIADRDNHRIRRVSPKGSITTVAGGGPVFASQSYAGDGSLALSAFISPGSLAIGPNGKIYFSDANAVRVLTPTGCDYAPSSTSLQAPVAGGGLSISITTGTGCAWTIVGLPDWVTLSGSPTFSGSSTVSFTIAANSGAPRAANVSIAGNTVLMSQASSVLLVSAGGVVNSASYADGVAPGSIVSVFGNFLLTNPIAVSSFPIPTNLGGLSIQFWSAPLAPLFYASAGQVNAQVPWEFMSGSITVTNAGQTSAPVNLMNVMKFAPGLYSINGQGTGQGAILDANFHLVDSTNPAIAGTTVVQIFCTGLGPVTNQPATGAAAPSNPLATTRAMPEVTIGGVSATVQFSGLTPGFVGLYQVNALVPVQAAGMGTAPVTLSVASVRSNTVTIAVR